MNALSELSRRLEPIAEWGEIDRDDCWGDLNQPIPPAALPHGLRFLQLPMRFNQSLKPGSIPDTVEVVLFGESHTEAGHLPASLTHLKYEHGRAVAS